MMKKIFSLMLLCAAVVFASCGNDDDNNGTPTPVSVSGVTLDKTALSITMGSTGTLIATVAPEDATDKSITWSSDKTDIATVKDGVVTAVAVGTANITATSVADKAKKATCVVTVGALPVSVSGVTLDKTALSITMGSTGTLIATVAPENATDKGVTWISDKTDIATVKDGVVTAVAVGTANITATSVADKTKKATCVVTVEKGITWATGNLVADEANNVKIGTATDGGLFFQFGSLVGWSTTGDPAIAVSPVGYTGSTSWSSSWTGDPATENVATGTGDPCKYYLKGTWRLPTKDEYVALFKDSGYPSGRWKWENASTTNTASGLIFPASGYRDYRDGSLSNVGAIGFYWSASPSVASLVHILYFYNICVNPSSNYYRASGLPVRCVK